MVRCGKNSPEVEQFWRAFAKMKESSGIEMRAETIENIEGVIDEIWDYLSLVHPNQDPKTILENMRQNFRIPANASAYQTIAANANICKDEIAALDPAEIYDLFDLLIDEDKRRELLLSQSDKKGKVIQSKLEIIRDQPLAHLVFLKTGKRPNVRPGRKSKMPDDDACRAICLFIAGQTFKKKIPTLRAQEEAGTKWTLSVRMVQRIWQRRDELLNDE